MQTRINADKSIDIWVYGNITDEKILESDITAYDVITALNKASDAKTINVHINSNGGDVYSGVAIYNALTGCGKPVTTIGEGIVASMASVIAMSGRFKMAENATLMVHNPLLMLFGGYNKHDMELMSADLDKVRETALFAYTAKTGKTRDEIIALLDGETGQGTFMSAREALAQGFCDEIIPASGKAAARLGSAMFRCRGKTYTYAFNDYKPIKTAVAKKEGINAMSRKTAARGGKFKAEIMPIECPHCHGMVDFDTETGIVSPNAAEGATVAVPMDAPQARRKNASFRNEVYKIKCPYCEGEFEYDFAPQAGVVAPDEPSATEFESGEPLIQARRVKAKKPRGSRRTHGRALRMELAAVTVDCVECGYTWDVEIDTDVSEATVVCPSCGAENVVDTSETAASPPAPPEEDPPQPEQDVPPAEAYRQGVYAERRRVTLLDQRKAAFPQYANAIDGFIKNGTSVGNATNWIFTAIAADTNRAAANPTYAAMSRRDAQPLNKIGNPARGSDTHGVIAANFASLAERRGTKK